ncbi:CRISPR-associated helicase/endonuclease Cas3 [Desulfogranum mediterraneum]|uniref:CRISPR-associated helicase/endonuclease Cas3 n=1 Tax=Desulfogranum mediterraneum TaxID=160661 RepID=UPI00041A2033|nr:DEAD/DEAH box helicase [Desulfogranum mediterraneum]
MNYAAHSPPQEFPDLDPHSYAAHVQEMLDYGRAQLDYILGFLAVSEKEKRNLRETYIAAIMLHDMGKLDESNQPVLKGRNGRLMVDHIDAGTAIAQAMGNELLAWLIRGHHAPGLPSRSTEKYFIKYLNKEVNLEGFKLPLFSLRGLRKQRAEEHLIRTGSELDCHKRHYRCIAHTDSHLSDYIQRQVQNCGKWPHLKQKLPASSITTRLLLSCLVDADHGSAAAYGNNQKTPVFCPGDNRWQQRLDGLKNYIEKKAASGLPEERKRNALRQAFFQHCCYKEITGAELTFCSAPVGLGKTTSVTAYLLRQAVKNNASRLIVVAPFTNIINQTVNTLRSALLLDGENPEQVVAAHHHKIDFSDEPMRQYNTLWRAPVVVTTAVQFFETLAAADPTRLRKLNAIAGAVIFIDESHACVPPEFFRITWKWLCELVEKWGCSIVLSSGSMIEFWSDDYLVGKDQLTKLPDLLSDDLRDKCQEAETSRITFKQLSPALTKNALVEELQSVSHWQGFDGDVFPSCLVILNTVQTAAVVAHALAQEFNELEESLVNRVVLHLSTALAPKDRDVILAEIDRRQGVTEWSNRRWFLIATSCVEAGIDLDFSMAFRERCSVTSLLQVAGRVNRHGRRLRGVVYDFTLLPEDGITLNPGFKESAVILQELWQELVAPNTLLTTVATKSVKKQFSALRKNYNNSLELYEKELSRNFQDVQDGYRIIKNDTRTVIIDEQIAIALESGVPVKWQDIQNNSVQLRMRKVANLQLVPIKNCEQDHIYSWVSRYEYDSVFLGIMGGMIKLDQFFQQDYGVV